MNRNAPRNKIYFIIFLVPMMMTYSEGVTLNRCFGYSGSLPASGVSRLGHICKFLVTNFLTKVDQIFVYF